MTSDDCLSDVAPRQLSLLQCAAKTVQIPVQMLAVLRGMLIVDDSVEKWMELGGVGPIVKDEFTVTRDIDTMVETDVVRSCDAASILQPQTHESSLDQTLVSTLTRDPAFDTVKVSFRFRKLFVLVLQICSNWCSLIFIIVSTHSFSFILNKDCRGHSMINVFHLLTTE